MRELVAGLSDSDLARMVTPAWNVAALLGHVAYWDQRALNLARKLERGEPFVASEFEPDDVDWINDACTPFFDALEPRALAALALGIAEATDAAVAALADRIDATADLPLNPLRAAHRGEHLDQIEAALR